MASVLLTVAGGALGAAIPGIGFLAGPVLGTLGGMAGAPLDAALGLGARAQGPRLESLRVQDSREGAALPIIYGMMRAAGNIIWASPLIEKRKTQRVGGKMSSASATTYSYSAHLAAAICDGPITGIHRIWADSKLIYDGATDKEFASSIRIYKGSAAQTPDALMESYEGSGNVPAYRNTAYVVVENLQLAAFGNRIPNLTFEVEGNSNGFAPQIIGGSTAITSNGGYDRVFWTGDELLVTGIESIGGVRRFAVDRYDWRNDGFIYKSRITSAPLGGNYANFSAALSPDRTRVYLMHLEIGANTSHIVYDVANAVFGSMAQTATTSLPYYTGGTAPFWIDDTTVLIRGANSSYLGFLPVTCAGATISLPLSSQFVPVFDTTTYWVDVGYVQAFGGTMCVMGTNLAKTVLKTCRLQRGQNGIVTSALPDIAIPVASVGTLHINRAADDNLLLIMRTTGGSIYAMTYALSTTGLAVSRSATLLPVSTSVYYCSAMMTGSIAKLVSESGALYTLAELELTDTGFTLTHNYTTASGTHTTSSSSPRLIRLSPYDCAMYSYDKIYWLRRGTSSCSVADILSSLSARAGLASGEMDYVAALNDTLPGFAVTAPMAARRAIEAILAAAPFALIESDGLLRLTDLRSLSPLTIANAETRATNDGTVAPVSIERKQGNDVPRAITLGYYDIDNLYQPGSSRAALDAGEQMAADSINLPVVMGQEAATRIAERQLMDAQAAQSTLTLTLSRAYAQLDVGDVISYAGNQWRISTLTQSGSLIRLTARAHNTNALLPISANITQSTAPSNIPTAATLLALDLPALNDDDAVPRLLLTASAADGWTGGVVYDAQPKERVQIPYPAITGIATTTLATGPQDYIDRKNTLTVVITNGALTSASDTNFLAGLNTALVGSEIIQFQNATLIAPNTYTLSTMLRGRFGTEAAISTHTTAERFVLLEEETLVRLSLTLADRGLAQTLQLVSFGQSTADTLPVAVTCNLKSLQPLSPAQLKAKRNYANNDVTISWVRRARSQAQWADYTDVPLDESSESYALTILSGSTVKRTTTVSTAAFTYTAAMQTADFGSTPSSFTISVAQISTPYGEGAATQQIFSF